METNIQDGIFRRTELLLGRNTLDSIRSKRVIIFGVGGVGSWCAESLVRSGISHLTIVDSDRVCATNINRQLMATTATVGKVKVEVLRNRLLEINPQAEIIAVRKIFNADNAASFELEKYDFIIDAIDSLSCKIHLIRTATRTNAVFFSSMGAALKIDASKIRVAEFWKVRGCPLGAALRKRIKRGDKPAKKFLCVYSDEVLPNLGEQDVAASKWTPEKVEEEPTCELQNHDWNTTKAQINGTMSHITAIFGFTIAGLVMQEIVKRG